MLIIVGFILIVIFAALYFLVGPRIKWFYTLRNKFYIAAHFIEILLIGISLPILYVLLVTINQNIWSIKDFDAIAYASGLFVFFYLLMPRIANLLSIYMESIDLKRLQHKKYPKPNSFFQWLEKDIDEKVFFDIFKKCKVRDDIQNLRLAKAQLKLKIGDDIQDYYLLKYYLESNRKNNILEKSGTIFSSIFTGLISALLTKLLTEEKLINKLGNYLDLQVDLSTNSVIANLIHAATFALVLATMILYTLNEFSRSKRRLDNIHALVEAIIEEKK
jgi:sorbitol-specific phosphotransferase system component IIC